MPKPVPLPPPGFDDLSVDERIDYLQSLWDRIAATPEYSTAKITKTSVSMAQRPYR